jgi:hypothetical protein
VLITGKALRLVYLWIEDWQSRLRQADHLRGWKPMLLKPLRMS